VSGCKTITDFYINLYTLDKRVDFANKRVDLPDKCVKNKRRKVVRKR
jgi:hypothetical protein